MTLIAATTNNDIPIIIGDILISSPSVSNIKIPSNIFPVGPYLDKNLVYKPSGFYQKIYIINSHVALAMAGDVSIMKWFLSELRLRCKYFDRLSRSHVLTFIQDLRVTAHLSDFGFLLLWMEEQGDLVIPEQVTAPSISWQTVHSIAFGQVFACGSGANTFLQRISANVQWEFSDPNSRLQNAITQNMIFLGTILAGERTSLFNVNELWGAGFEVIVYTRNGFEKYSNHAFVLFEAEVNSNGTLGDFFPNMVQYYSYFNDVLLITAVEISSSSPLEEINGKLTNHYNCSEALYCVPALDSDQNNFQQLINHDTSFDTNRLAIGFSIIVDQHTASYPGIFFEGTEAEVKYKNQRLTLTVPADILEKIKFEMGKTLKRNS